MLYRSCVGCLQNQQQIEAAAAWLCWLVSLSVLKIDLLVLAIVLANFAHRLHVFSCNSADSNGVVFDALF